MFNVFRLSFKAILSQALPSLAKNDVDRSQRAFCVIVGEVNQYLENPDEVKAL
jgi:hypothetical protein